MSADFIASFDEFGRRFWPLFLPVVCLFAWWFHYLLFKRQLKSALFRFRHRQIAGIARRRHLQESEERLRVILSSILTGVAVIDPRNRQIEFVNPAACRLLGGKKNDIIGRRIEEFELAVEELSGDDTGFSLLPDQPKQRHLTTLNGEALPVLENTSSIIIHGAPFLLKSYLDLSELVRARQKVELLHSNLTKRVQELHCLFGVTGLLAQALLPRQELLQRVVNLIPLAMRRPHFAVARIVLGDCSVSSETFVQTSWHLQRPIFVGNAEAGKVEVCYIKDPSITSEDIFEREEISLVETLAQRLGRHFDSKQAEKEQSVFSQLLDSSPGGLFVVEVVSQCFYYINNHGCVLLGLRHDDIVGRQFSDVFALDGDVAELLSTADEDTSTSCQLTLQKLHEDHSPETVTAHMHPISSGTSGYVAFYLEEGEKGDR